MSVGVLTEQFVFRLKKQCNNNSVSNSTGKNVQKYINEQLKLNKNRSVKLIYELFQMDLKKIRKALLESIKVLVCVCLRDAVCCHH